MLGNTERTAQTGALSRCVPATKAFDRLECNFHRHRNLSLHRIRGHCPRLALQPRTGHHGQRPRSTALRSDKAHVLGRRGRHVAGAGTGHALGLAFIAGADGCAARAPDRHCRLRATVPCPWPAHQCRTPWTPDAHAQRRASRQWLVAVLGFGPSGRGPDAGHARAAHRRHRLRGHRPDRGPRGTACRPAGAHPVPTASSRGSLAGGHGRVDAVFAPVHGRARHRSLPAALGGDGVLRIPLAQDPHGFYAILETILSFSVLACWFAFRRRD